jgi:hypothetical protein
LVFPVFAQQPAKTVQRDAQAIGLLSQSLNAAGGASQIAAVKDFTATGKITHFWAGEGVNGPSTLRGRGVDQIRIDSDLPGGSRSWVVHKGATSLRKNGKDVGAPYQTGVDSGAVNNPYFIVLAALNDPQVSISSIEHANLNEHEVLLVRTQRRLTGGNGQPDEFLSRRTAKEVLIDPSTYLPIALRSKVYPPKGFGGEFVQEVQFADFRNVNGVLVPFSMTETISGQRTWTFQADSIVLNSGLGESDLDQ